MNRRDFAMGLAAGACAIPGLAGATLADAWAHASSGADPALGQTDALLVLQNGKTIFERYGADGGPGVRHVSWSMAKSITQALTGVAVAEGEVDIDQPLITDAGVHAGLNLRALLTLTDGLTWNEGDYDPAKSDATRMLYGMGRFDGAAFTLAKTRAVAPGTRWNYSTGAFQLAAAELQARLFPEARTPEARRDSMSAWIGDRLFAPLEMTSAVAEFDPSGTFYGGSLVYATARDYARFGELYRLDGMRNGRRILPPDWVKFARTPTVQADYGAGFWLEAKPGAGHDASLMNGAGPMDGFSAQGHNGQVILIVPSKALTLVRLGLMDDGSGGWKALGAWITPIVNALPDARSA